MKYLVLLNKNIVASKKLTALWNLTEAVLYESLQGELIKCHFGCMYNIDGIGQEPIKIIVIV